MQAALLAGFTVIISIEFSGICYRKCVARFANDDEVHLFHGDSAETLEIILPHLESACTFFLDAHDSGLPEMKRGPEICPLLRELQAISHSPRKDHIILIDDARFFGTPSFGGITMDQAKQSLRSINPEYKFAFETGSPDLPNDILVAML